MEILSLLKEALMPSLQGVPAGRHGIPRKKSKKNFTKHAMHPHKKNFTVQGVMRGGIRF